MLKSKLCGFAIACVIGCVGASPISVLASETKSESVTLSEKNKDQKNNKSAFEDAMKKAHDKWNTLTENQKAEVYALLETEMKDEIKLLNKLVELGVLEKSDVDALTTRMENKLNELKKSGEFPLSRAKHEKKQR